MSVKQGSNFIAGNLAIKLQDRIFTASETMEGDQEYYDLTIPVGATLGFAEATRVMLLINGTNKTATPILRVVGKSDQFFIVTNYKDKNTLAPGMLVDGLIMDFYVINLTETKPNTNIKYIYLGTGGENYNYPSVANPPYFTGKDAKDIRPLVSGPNSFDDLGLPYKDGDNYNFGDIALIELQPNKAIYKGKNLQFGENATDTFTFVGAKPTWNSQALATEQDLADLAIGDQYVDMLVYARETVAQMNAITDGVAGNTCLVTANSTIYQKGTTGWEVKQVLDYNLTTDNGKYFIVEDVDGDHSGKVIWNVANGGEFKIFIDYSNSIDNNTLVRDPVSRDVEVAKVPNKLTIKYGDVNNTFDGSSALTIVFPEYYSKEDTDTQYNSQTAGKVLTLEKDSNDNLKIKSSSVDVSTLIIKDATEEVLMNGTEKIVPKDMYFAPTWNTTVQTLDDYINASTYVNGGLLKNKATPIDASYISYTNKNFTEVAVSNVKQFLDMDFAYQDRANNFAAGQTMEGSPIATQGWIQSEWYPNTFDFDILSNIAIQNNSPTTGNIALRLSYKPQGEDAISTKDIPLPLATASMAGLISPAQFLAINTLADTYVPKLFTTTNATQQIVNDGENNTLKAITSARQGENSSALSLSLLSAAITYTNNNNTITGINLRKAAGYYFEDEAVVYDDIHKMINKGYVDNKFLPINNIVTLDDVNTHWEGKKVALNGFDFTSLSGSSATYRLYGSDVETGTLVTHDHQFPIVNETTAGLATSAMYNQLDANTSAIANLQGQGYVGAELPENPSQAQIEAAWTAAKPTIPSVEGSSLLDLRTGNTWRKLDVAGTLTWENLGVLGGTGQATNATTGVVKGSASGAGTIFVENDATMNVNGWDELTANVANLDIDIQTVSSNLAEHIANTVLHISAQERQDWNQAYNLAQNAIPKFSSVPMLGIIPAAKMDGTLELKYTVVSTISSSGDYIPTTMATESRYAKVSSYTSSSGMKLIFKTPGLNADPNSLSYSDDIILVNLWSYPGANEQYAVPTVSAVKDIIKPYKTTISSWSGSAGNYYTTIPYSTHKKGLDSSTNKYYPRVRTFAEVVSGTGALQETYDSPGININTGEVTLYSNSNAALIVMIY